MWGLRQPPAPVRRAGKVVPSGKVAGEWLPVQNHGSIVAVIWAAGQERDAGSVRIYQHAKRIKGMTLTARCDCNRGTRGSIMARIQAVFALTKLGRAAAGSSTTAALREGPGRAAGDRFETKANEDTSSREPLA